MRACLRARGSRKPKCPHPTFDNVYYSLKLAAGHDRIMRCVLTHTALEKESPVVVAVVVVVVVVVVAAAAAAVVVLVFFKSSIVPYSIQHPWQYLFLNVSLVFYKSPSDSTRRKTRE